jgi:hypothetical protein
MRIMLGLVALGLVGYALWRLIQALSGPEREGRNARGIAKRIGYETAALVYTEAWRSASGNWRSHPAPVTAHHKVGRRWCPRYPSVG